MLYFAYGSNLNKREMQRRCPDAIPLRKFTLQDARLVFRGVADVIAEPGATCPGALWRITKDCERSLDIYEGIRSGLYQKVILPIERNGQPDELMMYVMNSTGIMPPSTSYLARVEQGYRDFGLPVAALHLAVRQSWDGKHKTFHERSRLHREGYAPRARVTGKAATGKNGSQKQKTRRVK
jgi:hypothetical protein